MHLIFRTTAASLLKAHQLGFHFAPREEVHRPGSRGGHGYFDPHGKWQYGDRPVAVSTPAPMVAASEPVAPLPPLLPPAEAAIAHAKTYAEHPQAQAWEVLEGEYVARQLLREKARAAQSAVGWQEAVENERPGTKKRREAEHQAAWWAADAARLAADDPARIGLARRHLALTYLQLVKAAISKGRPVPLAVLGQSIEFRKAADARARYDKGRATSFGNLTSAVDASMQAARGYKVKLQNGKRITSEQKAEIATGMDEIEAVVGPLKDVLGRIDVTVAHTSGRHPFLSTAGGMYMPSERTITMGIRTSFRHRDVASLAHELAHCLDFEAGRAAGLSARIYGGYYAKRAPRVSSSVADVDVNQGRTPALLRAAAESMTDTRVVDATLRARLNATNDIDEKERIERTKTKLGLYFREPCELWARLFEQYVAHRRGGKSGVSHDSSKTYETTPGYWGAVAFSAMVPAIEVELQRRLAMLRPVQEAAAAGQAGAATRA